MDEQIMVVPRKKLFGDNDEKAFSGFVPKEKTDFIHVIKKSMVSRPRKDMETNPEFKQIIPYSIFEHGGKIFIYKRAKGGGEARLHEKYSIGIGGHINHLEGDNLIEGMKREFHEELEYKDDYNYEIIGFINSDETPVDKVHFGVVFMLNGKTPDIKVAERDKLIGGLESIGNIEEKRELMENWSAYVFDNIKSRMI
ncbi:MAG: DNA mismatch repair protein MutT [Candidatus Aenigmarchaeota archaeon]|nr:DNA mismatch repair protein MutT [Candidatus Aenigmarchaeota archaeon]